MSIFIKSQSLQLSLECPNASLGSVEVLVK